MRLTTTLATLALTAVPAAAQGFDSCGTMEAGVTCPLMFRADSTGGLYVLDAPLTGLAVGDRVRAIGTLDPGCFTICNQGNGCIEMATLQACGPTSIGTPYCTGVPNSTGAVGVVDAFGSDVATDDDLTLVAASLPAGAPALFLCSLTQAFVPQPGASVGNLCLGGAIGRFVSQVGFADAQGEYAISTDPASGAQSFSLAALPQPTGSVAAMAGETWSFQAWHRDVGAGGAATSNFTEGRAILFR